MALIACCLLLALTAAACASETPGAPRLLHHVRLPEDILREQDSLAGPLRIAGDLRVGDLDGDGRVELVVYRCAGGAVADEGLKPCFLAACDLDGALRWATGRGGLQPTRPGPVLVHDRDRDGAAEVTCLWARHPRDSRDLGEVALTVFRGSDGRAVAQRTHPEVQELAGEGANWVHQRLLACDLEGDGHARDLVIKLGATTLAFDAGLELRWRHVSPWTDYGRCPAYIPAVGDLDGDGRDEVNGGYHLLDHDGRVRWQHDLAPNMDSVAIAPFGGSVRALCSGGGHVLDAEGTPVIALGADLVPHGQELRVGRFDPDRRDEQLVIRWNGHREDVLVVDTAGELIHRFALNPSHNHTGMETVRWHGEHGPDLLFNGGWLWDPIRGEGGPLPGLPTPWPTPPGRMAWWHAIPADLDGDGREELIVYDPWRPEVFIYGHAGASVDGPYAPSPRTWNARLMD